MEGAYIALKKTCYISCMVSFIGKSAIILELCWVEVDKTDVSGRTHAGRTQPQAGCHWKCLFNVISYIVQMRLTVPIDSWSRC